MRTFAEHLRVDRSAECNGKVRENLSAWNMSACIQHEYHNVRHRWCMRTCGNGDPTVRCIGSVCGCVLAVHMTVCGTFIQRPILLEDCLTKKYTKQGDPNAPVPLKEVFAECPGNFFRLSSDIGW